MKNLRYTLWAFSAVLFLASCKNMSPQPSDLVGSYTVTMSLRDGAMNTSAIKDTIYDAMTKASDEMQKAKVELNEEIDLSAIDTSTPEGKIEYAAKKFGKSMAEAALDMGELGKEMGGLFSGLAEGAMGMTKSILENMTFDVELQADGDIKSSGRLVNIGLNDKTWKVEGDDFIIVHANNKENQIMKITKRDSKGFTLTKDEVIIKFVKK